MSYLKGRNFCQIYIYRLGYNFREIYLQNKQVHFWIYFDKIDQVILQIESKISKNLHNNFFPKIVREVLGLKTFHTDEGKNFHLEKWHLENSNKRPVFFPDTLSKRYQSESKKYQIIFSLREVTNCLTSDICRV